MSCSYKYLLIYLSYIILWFMSLMHNDLFLCRFTLARLSRSIDAKGQHKLVKRSLSFLLFALLLMFTLTLPKLVFKA